MNHRDLSRLARVLMLASALWLFGCPEDEPEPEPEPECRSGAECTSGVCSPDGTCAFPACNDGVLNGQEVDVDCGGNCAECADGQSCNTGSDCASGSCSDGVCGSLQGIGGACTSATDCEIEFSCEPFDGSSICTRRCEDDSVCNGLSCLRGICTPNDYCDDPDGDGIGVGPGCSGDACSLCSPNADCVDTGEFSKGCVCKVGFEGDGATCTDVDECALGLDDCPGDALCTNTDGGFTCACQPGYTGDGSDCVDVDECADGSNDCDPAATCSNVPGSFVCSCPPGAQDLNGDGTSCSSVDECFTQQDDCHPQAICTDTPSSFTCECGPGYIDLMPSNAGRMCSDVDECVQGLDDCVAGATCRNLDGGFECQCPIGSTGDGRDPGVPGQTGCIAGDPCATANCGANSTCIAQTASTFVCVCAQGYIDQNGACVDIDECVNAELLCDPNATCTNQPGSYQCGCNSGYEDTNGDGTLCRQINECLEGTDQCDANASCTDTEGDYECECDAGYIGDGFTCRRPISCLELLTDQPGTRTGVHTINTGAGGDLQVWCDMQLDGGGYTFYKFEQPSAANARQAEATCASKGMQLFIPRSEEHLRKAYGVATSANYGPSGNANYMRILGVYPNRGRTSGFNGSTCLNTPLRSGNPACDWSASDNGPFYIHNDSNRTEPNGDCSTDASMTYEWTGAARLGYMNDIPSPGYTSTQFMCDTADKRE